MITLIAVASTIANIPFALFSALILLWACLADTPQDWWSNEKSTGADDTDAK